MQSGWDNISKIYSSKFVRSNYIWIILVPIIAKPIEKIENPLVLNSISEGLVIDIQLPFTWQIFFLSALACFIGNILYILGCPKLIRDFPTYSVFAKEGRSEEYLVDYALHTRGFKISDEINSRYENGIYTSGNLEDDRLENQKLFWSIYEHENKTKTYLQVLCVISYIFALYGYSVVVIQNIYFVFKQIEFPILS